MPTRWYSCVSHLTVCPIQGTHAIWARLQTPGCTNRDKNTATLLSMLLSVRVPWQEGDQGPDPKLGETQGGDKRKALKWGPGRGAPNGSCSLCPPHKPSLQRLGVPW